MASLDLFLFSPAKPGFTIFHPEIHLFFLSSRHLSVYLNKKGSQEGELPMEFDKIIQMEKNSIRNLFTGTVCLPLFSLLNSSKEATWVFLEPDVAEGFSRIMLGHPSEGQNQRKMLRLVFEYFHAIHKWSSDSASHCRLELKTVRQKGDKSEETSELLDLNSREDRTTALNRMESEARQKGKMHSAWVVFHFRSEKNKKFKSQAAFLFLKQENLAQRLGGSGRSLSLASESTNPGGLAYSEIKKIMASKTGHVSMVLDLPSELLQVDQDPSRLVAGLEAMLKVMEKYKKPLKISKAKKNCDKGAMILESIAQKSSRIKWEIHPVFSRDLKYFYENVLPSLSEFLTHFLRP